MEEQEYEQDNSTALAPRNNQLARRDFSGSSMVTSSAATDALVAKERAGVEARWIMAMRRPRNMDDVRQLMLKECRRPGFADAAVYEIPRGGSKITGLSIRFAEVAVRCMGNLQPEVVTIYDDDEQRIVRCTVTDYESNVTWSKDITVKKTVERRQLAKNQRPLGERINSYGDRVFIVPATDDDTNTKEAALVSKSLRTLILRCIPGHLQDECLALCNKIYADKAAKDPDAERVRVLDAFAQNGVMPSEIEELLGHTTERMSPAELDKLRKLFAAINEGHTSIADALEEARAERAAAAKATPKAAAAPVPATTAPQPAQATNEQPPQQPATQPAAAPAKPATRSGGKGTAGLKSKLDTAAEQARERDAARVAQPKPDPETEPGWMASKQPSAEQTAEPATSAPPTEEPKCTDCGVPVHEPGRCYACAQS